MSVEATGWAFRQKVPPKPKMVLMALADQTDEKTGSVCYGKTDMAHLADKASVPVRSLARYISALVHNGYAIRESGRDPGGRQRANSYWLVLDRPVGASIDEWKWPGAKDDDDDGDGGSSEPQDIVEPCAKLADGETVENSPDRMPPNGSSPSAIGGIRQDSSEVPEVPLPHARSVPVSRSSSFSRKAQDAELENLTIAKAAAKENTKYFVIEHSRAWQAWCAYRRSRGQVGSMPTCSGQGEYVNRRGWWMPSLFPPNDRTTGPPNQELSDEDAKAFTQGK